MPTLISRAEALRRIEEEGKKPACLMCAIVGRKVGEVHAVYEDEAMLVMLPRYVRRWGHVMVVPKPHVVDFAGASAELWARTSQLAHQTARMVERVMRPRRVYMASTGSSAGELTQTSMHLHVHVIPLYEADDKPSDIFSWNEGVYVGAPEEWAELLAKYRPAWGGCWP